MADSKVWYPEGIVKNILVRVKDSFILVGFAVLVMEGDFLISLNLGRPFLRDGKARISLNLGRAFLRDGKSRIDVGKRKSVSASGEGI